jgi:hypothetical protein
VFPTCPLYCSRFRVQPQLPRHVVKCRTKIPKPGIRPSHVGRGTLAQGSHGHEVQRSEPMRAGTSRGPMHCGSAQPRVLHAPLTCPNFPDPSLRALRCVAHKLDSRRRVLTQVVAEASRQGWPMRAQHRHQPHDHHTADHSTAEAKASAAQDQAAYMTCTLRSHTPSLTIARFTIMFFPDPWISSAPRSKRMCTCSNPRGL